MKQHLLKIWNKIQPLFKRKTVKIGDMYFVKHGEMIGKFLILIDFDSKKRVYSVLELPDSGALYINETDIEQGINKKILDFVRRIPKGQIFNDCQNEFKYRETNK